LFRSEVLLLFDLFLPAGSPSEFLLSLVRLGKRGKVFFHEPFSHLRLFRLLFDLGGRRFIFSLFNQGNLNNIPGCDFISQGNFPGKEKHQHHAVKKKGYEKETPHKFFSVRPMNACLKIKGDPTVQRSRRHGKTFGYLVIPVQGVRQADKGLALKHLVDFEGVSHFDVQHKRVSIEARGLI